MQVDLEENPLETNNSTYLWPVASFIFVAKPNELEYTFKVHTHGHGEIRGSQVRSQYLPAPLGQQENLQKVCPIFGLSLGVNSIISELAGVGT